MGWSVVLQFRSFVVLKVNIYCVLKVWRLLKPEPTIFYLIKARARLLWPTMTTFFERINLLFLLKSIWICFIIMTKSLRILNKKPVRQNSICDWNSFDRNEVFRKNLLHQCVNHTLIAEWWRFTPIFWISNYNLFSFRFVYKKNNWSTYSRLILTHCKNGSSDVCFNYQYVSLIIIR